MYSETSWDDQHCINPVQGFQRLPNSITPHPPHHSQYMPPPPTQFSIPQFPNLQPSTMNFQAQPSHAQFPMYNRPATQFQVTQSRGVVGFSPQPAPLPFQYANNSHFRASYAFNPRFSANIGGGAGGGQRYENGSAVTPVVAQSNGKVWPRGNFYHNPRQHQQRFAVARHVQTDWSTYGVPSQFGPVSFLLFGVYFYVSFSV